MKIRSGEGTYVQVRATESPNPATKINNIKNKQVRQNGYLCVVTATLTEILTLSLCQVQAEVFYKCRRGETQKKSDQRCPSNYLPLFCP